MVHQKRVLNEQPGVDAGWRLPFAFSRARRRATQVSLLDGTTHVMHLFVKSQFGRLLRDARGAARDIPGTEICGLLVDTGLHPSFVQTRNASPRIGSFVLSGPDVRRIVAATKVLRQEVVGTFH